MSHLARLGLVAVLGIGSSSCCSLDNVGLRETHMRPYVNGKPVLPVGESTQFVAEARGAAPCVLYRSDDRPNAFHWRSSDTTVATISQQGLAMGRSVGDVLITAETDGFTGRFAITIVSVNSVAAAHLTNVGADEHSSQGDTVLAAELGR
jgi:hypothetical protein